MEKVIIFGEGKIQEVAYFYLKRDDRYEIAGFTADSKYISSDTYLEGYPIFPFEDIENILPPDEYKMFVPIGCTDMNHLRQKKYMEAKRKGYSFITYINPKAMYYGTPVGENCFIFENNVIQPYTTIGDNVIMWSGSHLGHHSTIGSHCFIAPHVAISGGTVIGDYSFIGVNASIADGVVIGRENLIGAGAVITKSTEDKSVYVPERSILLDVKSDMISFSRKGTKSYEMK